MKICDWLEGDGGEEERGYCGEGEFPSDSGGLFLLGNLPHWDQIVGQDHLTIIYVASPRNLSMCTCFCLHFRMSSKMRQCTVMK